ncbi:Crp/Fnr family transcriptional regulator [Hydrogenophaga sp.]|uniref:Crp/Fnr family transcriptional regulator n=1 Tax=Hydrogenophaga sp. TaxID=1904254 RepID=UPI003F6F139C
MNLLHNGLVAQLPPADQGLLLRRCEPVELTAGDVLSLPDQDDGHVHFLTSACVALVVRQGDSGLAVGLAGREGAVGLQLAFGMGTGSLTLLVQQGGGAFRAEGAAMHRLANRRMGMTRVFANYLWGFSQEVAMLAAAAQLQDIRARLARWILLSHARSQQVDMQLTHLHLAEMLGVRRAGVTLAARELKAMGLVNYQRGRIQIVDTAGLEAVANALPGANGQGNGGKPKV